MRQRAMQLQSPAVSRLAIDRAAFQSHGRGRKTLTGVHDPVLRWPSPGRLPSEHPAAGAAGAYPHPPWPAGFPFPARAASSNNRLVC